MNHEYRLPQMDRQITGKHVLFLENSDKQDRHIET